jgi:hypothetical protein
VRLVSNQSEAEIRRLKAREALTLPWRTLAANILRIANGAGRPADLMKQLTRCTNAMQAYLEAHGRMPPEQLIRDILDCDRAFRGYRPWVEERRTKISEGMQLVRRGALQVVASMLLDQLTLQHKAEYDIHSGAGMLQEAKAMKKKHRPKNHSDL